MTSPAGSMRRMAAKGPWAWGSGGVSSESGEWCGSGGVTGFDSSGWGGAEIWKIKASVSDARCAWRFEPVGRSYVPGFQPSVPLVARYLGLHHPSQQAGWGPRFGPGCYVVAPSALVFTSRVKRVPFRLCAIPHPCAS